MCHIDWTKQEAIRCIDGMQERQKLVANASTGFAECTWPDGSLFQSQMANLMLQLKPNPKVKVMKKKNPKVQKKPARKKPAAAKPTAAAADYEEEGEEEKQDDADEEQEEEEKNAEEQVEEEQEVQVDYDEFWAAEPKPENGKAEQMLAAAEAKPGKKLKKKPAAATQETHTYIYIFIERERFIYSHIYA